MSATKSDVMKLSEKDLAFWRQEIKAARQKRQEVADTYGWDENLKRYVPKPSKNAEGALNADVNIGIDFADVERKKAALFYDTPDVGLSVTQDREIAPASPTTPALQLSTLVMWQQEILNELLGPQHANVKPTILKAIFNCLCPSGVGPVSVGYQVTMKTVPRETPVLDELGQPMMQPVPALEQVGAALGLMPPPMPVPLMTTVDVDIPIYERWYVSGSSPKALLVPASWRDTDFQRAPWLGNDFRKPTSQIKRENPSLPKDWKAGGHDDQTKPYFENGQTDVSDDDAGDPYVTGVELFYRTAIRSDKEVHPEAMRKLILLDGSDEPLVHMDSPYQDFTEDGELTPDSLKGFCVRPLVLRDLSDSAWIPSDCSVTAQLTKEVEKYREQSITQRDTNHNVILYDSAKVDPTAKDKIVKGPGGTWVPLIGDALAAGKDSIMVQAAQVSLGRENFIGQDYIMSDREKILGIGSNQTGQQSKGRKTATEQSIVQRNSEARFEQERQRVLEWYLNDIVRPFDTLILRYADARIAVQILGEVRGQLWAKHKHHLAGGYGYEVSIDGGKYLDVEADRRQMLQLYGQLRQDPYINPRPLLTKLASKFDFDPAELITQPQPPPKELKAAISIKGEDLNPANPAFAIMVELARQGGWNISPESVQLAQQQSAGMTMVSGVAADPNAKPSPQHPGTMAKAPTINQHVVDLSGDRSGPKTDTGSVM